MKLVWQTEDGTIFENEEEAEAYEDKCADLARLTAFLEAEYTLQDVSSFLEILADILKNNKQYLVSNYISNWSPKR